MKEFINRDFNRTEDDDWKLNVQPKLSFKLWSLGTYVKGVLIGWHLIGAYE